MAVFPTFTAGNVLSGAMLRGAQVEIVEATTSFSVAAGGTVIDPELLVRLERNASYCVELNLLFRCTGDTLVDISFTEPFTGPSYRMFRLGPTESAGATDFVNANETRLSLESGTAFGQFLGSQINADSVDHAIIEDLIINTSSSPFPLNLRWLRGGAGTLTRSPGSFMRVTRFA